MKTNILKPAIIAASLLSVLVSCSSTKEEKISSRETIWNAFTLPSTVVEQPAGVTVATDDFVVVSSEAPDPIMPVEVETTPYVSPQYQNSASGHIMPGRGRALRNSY